MGWELCSAAERQTWLDPSSGRTYRSDMFAELAVGTVVAAAVPAAELVRGMSRW